MNKETKDPPRGRIERNASGEPSGTLREGAMELVERIVPPVTDKVRLAGLEKAQALANSFGITSIQDADANPDVLNAYLELQRQSKLTLKVVAALHTDPAQGPDQVQRLLRMREKFTCGRLRCSAAKIFADGVIEAHTASLMEPYSDRPGYSGIANYSAEALDQLVSALSLARFQVHIHAIGDRAVHDALDAFKNVSADSHALRPEIAHLELVAPEDIKRFRQYGVIANCQAFWAFNDPYIQKCTVPLIGAERCKRLYPFQSIYQTGATIAGGSDWPVTTLNPLDAIQVAVTRQPLDNPAEAPLLANERMALPDMIAAYTINGAYVNHEENETGS
ncbi:MAG: amidohydrolase, partial [Terriglobales bacterium]